MRPRRPLVGAVLLAATTLAPGGCIIIPTPDHGNLGGREPLDNRDYGFVRPGSTTREDVLLALGMPEHQPAPDTFVYWWEVIMAYIAFGGGYSGDIAPIGRNHMLLIEFDDAGRVDRMELTSAETFEPREGPVEDFLEADDDVPP